MIWNRMLESQKPLPAPNGTATVDTRGLLEAISTLLRILGRYAFDMGELDARAIDQTCERWAQHILNGAPDPDSPGRTIPPETAEPCPEGERNWRGLHDFVTRLRRQENSYVTTHLKEIRQVIGDFVQTIGKIFADDREEQAQINAALNDLKKVIENNAPLDILSREAMHAVGLISQIAEEHNRRHQNLLEELSGKLKAMRSELDEAKHEMELDPLTRLYNRKAFDEQLVRVFELNKLSGQPACLLMLDVDHFKSVNDRHGHAAGDQVLKHLANCCFYTFPRKDDFVARYGGEEFVIILQETTLKTATMLCERLLRAIRTLRIALDRAEMLSITVSVGIAELDPRTNPDQWLTRADNALYRAKQQGRDQIQC